MCIRDRDYSAYQDYLSQLGTLHDYYPAQEQQQAARRQQVFSNVMTVLGVLCLLYTSRCV